MMRQDENLRRGRPLYLQPQLYSHLVRAWLVPVLECGKAAHWLPCSSRREAHPPLPPCNALVCRAAVLAARAFKLAFHCPRAQHPPPLPRLQCRLWCSGNLDFDSILLHSSSVTEGVL